MNKNEANPMWGDNERVVHKVQNALADVITSINTDDLKYVVNNYNDGATDDSWWDKYGKVAGYIIEPLEHIHTQDDEVLKAIEDWELWMGDHANGGPNDVAEFEKYFQVCSSLESPSWEDLRNLFKIISIEGY